MCKKNDKNIVRLSEFEEKFFQEECEKNRANLINIAKKICHNAEAAEDIVQESYIKAYKNFSTFNFSKKFINWMISIVQNTALDYLRKNKNNTTSLNELEDNFDDHNLIIDSHIDLEKLIMDRSQLEAIQLLKPKYKVLLKHIYFDQLSYEEVAEIENIPVYKVRSRINKAKSILIEKLNRAAK